MPRYKEHMWKLYSQYELYPSKLFFFFMLLCHIADSFSCYRMRSLLSQQVKAYDLLSVPKL